MNKVLRPRKDKGSVFSTDDSNSIERIRGLKQTYDPYLYGDDAELARNKETMASLISRRAAGEEANLPRNKWRWRGNAMADETEKEFGDKLYLNKMYGENPEGTENLYDDEVGYEEPEEIYEAKKATIKLTESQLHNFISESVKKVLNEVNLNALDGAVWKVDAKIRILEAAQKHLRDAIYELADFGNEYGGHEKGQLGPIYKNLLSAYEDLARFTERKRKQGDNFRDEYEKHRDEIEDMYETENM